MTAECPYTLQWYVPPPSKLPIPMGDLDPHNTWFPGSSRVLNPNGISIGSAVFAALTSVTDRQTDRPTDRSTDHASRSVSIGRIYVRSTAMRPKMFKMKALFVASTKSSYSSPVERVCLLVESAHAKTSSASSGWHLVSVLMVNWRQQSVRKTHGKTLDY